MSAVYRWNSDPLPNDRPTAKLQLGGPQDFTLDPISDTVSPEIVAGETVSQVSATARAGSEINVGDGVTTFAYLSGASAPAAPSIIDTNTKVMVWLWATDDAVTNETYYVDVTIEYSTGVQIEYTMQVKVIDG